MAFIVTWPVEGLGSLTLTTIKKALESAGLETGWARELLPRYAWTRAISDLKKDKVIRPLREDDDYLIFQFNGILPGEDHIDYPQEAQLRLNKTTGEVVCLSDDEGSKELARRVGERVADETGRRGAKDITRLIHRTAERDGMRLRPVRKGSGFFLVTEDPHGTLDKIDAFMGSLMPGFHSQRYLVQEDDAVTRASVADVVVSDMDELVADFEAKTNALLNADRKVRSTTLQNQVAEVGLAKLKIEAAAQYLEDQRSGLLQRMEAVKQKVEKRLQAAPQETSSSAA